MLEFRNLSKTYPDGTRALKSVSFSVQEQDFLALAGLSGSGKSTLLRCINRLVEPTSGSVFLNGCDLTALNTQELRRERRSIGMIFQHFNLVSRLDVITNVLTGSLGRLRNLRPFPSEERQKARAILERVGLAGQASKRVSELSGGQQQRVGIARTLMQNPRIILADEPVASLDPVLSYSAMDLLEQLCREDGITVICSLHHPELVRRYATRVAGLRGGRLVWQGTADIDDRGFAAIYGEDARRPGAL